MPLKRIVLIIMCTTLSVMVIMMGVMVGKVSPILGMLFGSEEDPVSTNPPTTTQPQPSTSTTVEPSTEPSVPTPPESSVPSTSVPKHEHDFSKVKEEKKASCAEAGYTIYECGCGETTLETFAVLPHSFGAGKLVSPTCTEGGYTLRKCSLCNYEEKIDVKEALGHDYKKVGTVSATCDQDGYEEYQCQRCDVLKRENIVKATGHAWVAGEVHASTCEEDGYTEYTCSNEGCGETKEDDKLPALGHDFTDWVIKTEPAPSNPGKESRECKTCQASEERELELYMISCLMDTTENYSALIHVGAKNSAGQEITVYSYNVTDQSRTLTGDSFRYDPEAGLVIVVKDPENPLVLAPGNGNLTLDKDGKPTAEQPNPSGPDQEPDEPAGGSTTPTETTGQSAASEPAGGAQE